MRGEMPDYAALPSDLQLYIRDNWEKVMKSVQTVSSRRRRRRHRRTLKAHIYLAGHVGRRSAQQAAEIRCRRADNIRALRHKRDRLGACRRQLGVESARRAPLRGDRAWPRLGGDTRHNRRHRHVRAKVALVISNKSND